MIAALLKQEETLAACAPVRWINPSSSSGGLWQNLAPQDSDLVEQLDLQAAEEAAVVEGRRRAEWAELGLNHR